MEKLYILRNYEGKEIVVYWNEVNECIYIEGATIKNDNDDCITLINEFNENYFIDFVSDYFIENCLDEMLERQENEELTERESYLLSACL